MIIVMGLYVSYIEYRPFTVSVLYIDLLSFVVVLANGSEFKVMVMYNLSGM